jgi:hypothetical protein
MKPLVVDRLPENTELKVPVASTSTIRVKSCAYSLPSRLIGERVRVHLYEHRLEVYYLDKLELGCDRLRGKSAVRIDYRHVIWSLVRKPGAFARYVYREELFPTLTFRRAYDAIQARHPGIKGDVEYLRILHLAASTLEADVEQALTAMLATGAEVTAEATKRICKPARADAASVPALETPPVDLTTYDLLLAEAAS